MSEERKSPFTGAGKVLFLGALGIFCGGFYWVFIHLVPTLPSRSYPLYYLLGPVVIAAVLFFFIGATILRRKGIAVLTSEKEEIGKEVHETSEASSRQ